MNINLTLLGQSITFAIFVWFCMKFIWPPIIRALDDRKQSIADGLAAAQRGHHEKELAEKRAKTTLTEAKEQAKEIIAQAHKRADEIVDEAKTDARAEGQRLVSSAQAEIEKESHMAREQLRAEVVAIAMAGAEQVLMREVDKSAHDDTLTKLAARL
jgi:F-type H+-transporting ATPase subunit b